MVELRKDVMNRHLPLKRSALLLCIAVAGVLALPHPSPRNNGWFVHNAWFERELVPRLRERVAEILAASPQRPAR
jgi:hypothetical protein